MPFPRTYREATEQFMQESALNAPQSGWHSLPFFTSNEAHRLTERLDAETAQGAQILPPPDCLYKALHLTPLQKTRVVILGQDPYPTPHDAHGLAFSCLGKAPRSLMNIFKEMQTDLGCAAPPHADLTHWAHQGVLLLNTALSVRAHAAASHKTHGWHALSDQVIKILSETNRAVVFILWGADAKHKIPLIEAKKHLILHSAHPSPLSAHRGFFGSKPFSKTNTWLQNKGIAPINWQSDTTLD